MSEVPLYVPTVLLNVGSVDSCFTEMCSGSEEGSYLRLIDFCITQL